MSDATVRAMAENVVEAFTVPRLSARRIMAIGPSFQDCVLMAVLAFAVQGLTGEIGGRLLTGSAGPGIGHRIAQLAVQLAIFLMLSWGVYDIGRRFGGEGTREDCMAVVAWHVFATAFLAPFTLLGVNALTPDRVVPGILFFLAPLTVVVSIWMFASFVAEAHGFQRLAPVVFASIIGFFLTGIVAFVLLGVVTGGPPAS